MTEQFSDLNSYFKSIKKCPNCDYYIPKIDIESTKFDFLCPRCQGPKLSEFIEIQSEDTAFENQAQK